MLQKVRDYLLRHRTSDIALLVIISLAATSNWFNLEIPKGHDAVGDMLLARAASDSIFLHHMFPGWTNDWFLGYPLFYVHPPLVSYLILALSFPFGWVLGTKLLYLSFFILSGVFAYFYVYELTKNRYASFVAGLAYIFLPYHIIEVGFEGHQGAFGMPYMLTPLILLCLERLIKKPGIKYVLINGILLALLTLTYPQVSPFLVGPFLALYIIFRIAVGGSEHRKHLKNVIIALAQTLGLALLTTAFWWLPLLSEIHLFHATQFSLADASASSATFLQAITLRPGLCCAPSSAYGSAGSIFLEILRMIPFILVSLGIILNRKNKYIWFFSASILIAVLLAMGPDSPINIFGFAHRYIPLFSGLRTPVRFLLFTSLAYAVLIGFCTKAITEWLGRSHLIRPKFFSVSLIGLLLMSLIIVGNTWQETRTAFSTFNLTTDQQNAFAWLKAREDGNYRITDLPFNYDVYTTHSGYMIDPIFWTYLHGKETVFGAVPAAATAYTGDTLDYLNYDLENSGVPISEWLNIFNVRYVLLDKTNPLHSNIDLGENFELVWASATIDIYENHAMKPRIFSFSTTDERYIHLWSDDQISVRPAEGDDVRLMLDSEHIPSHDIALKATYQFTEPWGEWRNLSVDVNSIHFDGDDAIHLVFYSDDDLPDIYMSLDLLERDGSRYGLDLNRVGGIKAGWNEIDFPISLLPLRYSIDENNRLDTDQIETIWFGPGEQGRTNRAHEFQLYFSALSVVSHEINTSVEYTKTRPGKYEVHASFESLSYLVLSESYHPNWVARVNGKTIHSQIIYQCLNSFYLEPGEYDITLEFVTSPLRTAANLISGITFLIIGSVAVLLLIRNKRRRGSAPPDITDPCKPQA